jgi:hydrogenase maturation factor HypF (carbamoyltransferase family)
MIAKYAGPWNEQCPFCMSRRVHQELRVKIVDGERYDERADEADCRKCGRTWIDYEIQFRGCPKCGVHHSGDITGTIPYRRADGSRSLDPLLMCNACNCYYDQVSHEIIPDASIEWEDI